jgi:hypothetical protein
LGWTVVSIVSIELLESRRLLASVGAFTGDLDIGSPGLPGSASFSNGTYTIVGSGADIGGTNDQFHFTFDPWNGDGTMVARVESIGNTDSAAKAGLMFRSGTAANAAFGGIFVTPGAGVVFSTRAADGGATGQAVALFITAPRYLRLTRNLGQLSAFWSANGSTWTQVGSTQSIGLGADALAGLAVTSRNVAATTTGVFTHVSLLPAGWNTEDIGAPSLAGSTRFDQADDRFIVSGGGAGITGGADQFSFVSRNVTGDGSILARIDSLSAGQPSAEAGLMFRNDTSVGSIFAAVGVDASSNVVFKWRSASNAGLLSASVSNLTTPVWLKLTHLNGAFTAHYSLNNIQWTPVGATQPLAMTSAIALGGVFAAAHDSSVPAEASFSSVSILPGEWSRVDVGSTSQPGSVVHDVPGNTSEIRAGGTGIGGASDGFLFTRRALSGNGSAAAFVGSISSADASARAGVMFRADDSASSPFVAVFVTGAGALVVQWRLSSGQAVAQQLAGNVAAPVSLKLTRSGNTFFPYYSLDGTSWLAAGAGPFVLMPATVLAGVAVTSGNDAEPCNASVTGAAVGANLPPGSGIYSANDELFLDDLSQRLVRFFYDETNPTTGLTPDGALASGGSNSSASSIASVGFGLTALTIGDRRGWLTHQQAYQRALTTLTTLQNTPAAQHQGFFYHFLNPVTGARSPGSELSSIDTALLMAGVLNVAQHWSGTPLATLALNLFNNVNWPFMQMGNGRFWGAWDPATGFSGGYVDFSEAVLLYLLGLGSPTHPIARSSWTAWSRTPTVTYGSYSFLTATTRALFTVQYPQAWYDLRGLTDGTGVNYYNNSINATLAQRQWMSDLSGTYPHWGPNAWGLTASDSQFGYAVWGGPPAAGPIDGTLVPTGPGGSLAFTPRYSVDALRHMRQSYGGNVYRKYAFVDAFNPHNNWTSPIVLGIDQGMMLAAAENSRSGFIWDKFMQTAVARQSMAAAFPSLTPVLNAAVSRKVRPDAVVVDTSIKLDGALSIENHQGGPTQLVLSFGANIVKGSNFAISVSGVGGTVTSSTVDGSTLTINLSGVADAQTLTVNISDLRNYSDTASGAYTLHLGVLAGDANQDGRVDVADLGILASNWQLSGSPFTEADFDFSGTVEVNDLGILASNWQAALSAAAPSSRFPASGALIPTPAEPFAARGQIRSRPAAISSLLFMLEDQGSARPLLQR